MLGGSNGCVLWTDVNGDVLVTGVVQNMSDEGGNYGDVIVAKLDGSTGNAARWWGYP